MSAGAGGSNRFLARWEGVPTVDADALVDPASRRAKADKIIAVARDALGGDLSNRRVLDIGCSAGLIAAYLAEHACEVVGVDPDHEAIALARSRPAPPNLRFHAASAESLGPEQGTFDLVVCNHIYEHAPDQPALFAAIERLLAPGGVCYFSAGNRLMLIEGHYGLPFLSWVPIPLAHLYVRALGRGRHYEERHRTLWSLRRLARRFAVDDYTLRVIAEPERFASTDLIPPGSPIRRFPPLALRLLYPLLPTYLWILRRR